MTLEEARVAISEGKKVTHRYFTDDEYIHMGKNGISFEDGVKVPADWWDKDYLKTDWSIYQKD